MGSIKDGQSDHAYHDLTATTFKKKFGQNLEHAFRGGRVRITRHGRTDERIVILREAELMDLEARTSSPLDVLRVEFDRLVERMQSDQARNAAVAVGTASTKELAQAAVHGFAEHD